MSYLYAKDSPPTYQWDADSPRPGYSAGQQFTMKSTNCGPSVMNRIAEYYQNANFNIWQTRNLGTSEPYHSTNINEQKAMLDRRGVACTIYARPSLATLKNLIEGGKHPIGVGLYMARVPYEFKDHPFGGMHSVELTHNERRGGQGGVGFFDPNFSPLKGRPDPDNGRKWMPDWVLDYAFYEVTLRTRSFALVPNRAKLVSAPLPDTSLPAATGEPMLKKKFQPWKANAGGTPIYETPNGKLIRVIPAGTELSSSGETLDGVWRSVLAEVSGPEFWVYAKRSTMTPLPPPPATRTTAGDPAYDKAVTDHVLSRIA